MVKVAGDPVGKFLPLFEMLLEEIYCKFLPKHFGLQV
jgi:hypothetical protein